MRARPAVLLTVLALAASVAAVPAVASAPVAGGLPLLRAAGTAVEKSRTITRTHVVNGDDKQVERREFTVRVDTTTGLRDRQAINVSWSGAHPTGGIVADPNSATAATQQEYPVVLMQCRGVDSRDAPVERRIRPETCWTQTPFERFSSDYNTTAPPWRLDRYAPAAERQQQVNEPRDRPAACFGAAEAERWVPFVAASGKTYRGGPNACAGAPPEATSVGSLDLPSNTTYATSSKGGKGAAKFNVRTSGSNASLGCSTKVDCALVVIPIVGISCDSDATGLPASERPPADQLVKDAERCEARGRYEAGQNATPNVQADSSVTGALWWSESNWRNRVTIPLSFASLGSACDITRAGGVSLFGSELLIQATEQWSPVFCLDPSRTPVKHVQTGEPQARNLIKSGSIEAGLVSAPPGAEGYGRPVVSAPVAMSGFAISYTIDGSNGRQYDGLKLTPRLLAKLMTSSYPSINAIRFSYEELSENPLNIAADPEFIALNPDVPENVSTVAAATMLSLSSDSDVIRALTSYIDADPEARAWLDGKPDPWGMRVNPSYEGVDLPTDTWRMLDSFVPDNYAFNDCLAAAPVPFLPLVAAPVTRLSQISLSMQFSIATSQITCVLPSPIPGNTDGAKLVAIGRQTPGFRFMIGVTSLADAERYEADSAALQTQVSGSAPAKFTSDQGRKFVAPTDSSLREAARFLKPEPTADMWKVSYGTLRDNEQASSAYPGTLPIFAAVASEGLPQTDAKAYAEWIRYVVTDGQRRGSGAGDLPAGYLPLTAENGLEGLAKYALRAADAIEDQSGEVPPVRKGDSPSDPNLGVPTAQSPVGLPGGPGEEEKPPTAEEDPGLVSVGLTTAISAGTGGMILPAVLALAALAGLLAGLTLVRARLRRRSWR